LRREGEAEGEKESDPQFQTPSTVNAICIRLQVVTVYNNEM